MLYRLLLGPLLRSLASKAKGDTRHGVPPLVQAYCDDLLLIVHTLPQFLAEAIARYLADMGMSLNVCKCAYATTAHISSIMVHLDQDNAVAPWLCLGAKSEVPYLGLRFDPAGKASMKERHVLRYESLLGWCKNPLGPTSVPHELMAAVVGGMVWYAAPHLSNAAAEVVRLNAAIKTATLQFENLPKDLSNVVVRSGKGLRLADVRVPCPDSMVAIVSSRIIARPWSRRSRGPCWTTRTRMGCADSLWFRRRNLHHTRETRGLTVCSGRWEHWASVCSCRP